MAVARRVVTWLILPMAILSGYAAAQDAATPEAAWQGPAAAAAEAAAAKAKDAIVPPTPKAAERPQAKSGGNPPEEKAAPVKAVAPVPAAKAPEPAVTAAPKPDVKAKPDAKEAEKPKKPVLAAKQLFGTVKTPAPMAARAVGWYAKGCLAGGKPLTVDGPGWQVMRLSRNRNWGHPDLVALLERLARETTQHKEWPGLLVGDMSQPRGGPMTSGHASHQVGLDADIWLTPMPDRKLTKREREDMSAVSMLANAGSVDPKVWGDGQVKLIKRAASYSSVERILVHPAIKKALCESAGTDRTWLSKVRPYFGHYYHFHIRIGCPKGSNNCQHQPPVPTGDGCDAELKDWLKKVAPKPKPPVTAQPPEKPAKPAPPKPQLTLADLPQDCRAVLTAGGNAPPTVPADVVDSSKDAGPEKDVTLSTAAPEPPPEKKKAAPAKKSTQ